MSTEPIIPVTDLIDAVFQRGIILASVQIDGRNKMIFETIKTTKEARMRTVILVLTLAVGMLMSGFLASDAGAVTIINILDIGDSGTTADGTIFSAEPNPSTPSTGTGVFEPFLRVGAGTGALTYGGGLELGYNTDTPEAYPINYDTKNGSNWTRSVLFSELGVIDGYFVLSLDANEAGGATSSKNRIVITDLQIYIGPGLATPEAIGGYTGTVFDSTDNGLAGLAPVWTLDNATNGDVNVVLQASICEATGQCGSGHGDLDVFIPQSLLSGLDTDYFVLYTEYSGASDGFEEWRFNATSVPEPATASLLIAGLLGLGLYRRLH